LAAILKRLAWRKSPIGRLSKDYRFPAGPSEEFVLAVLHFHNTETFWENVGGEFAEEISVGSAATGVRLAHFVMSHDKDDMDAALASMFYMPPGFELPNHEHDCFRVEVVVQGSLRVGDKVLHPGDVSVSAPGEPYGPHIAGPTGCLTMEVFSRQSALAPKLHVEHWTESALEAGAKYRAAVAAWRKARGKTGPSA